MKTIKPLFKVLGLMTVFLGTFFVSTHVFADPVTSGVQLSDVSKNIQGTVSSLAVILNNVALIAGIGFVMASFFKFHQHKLNPTQVPMSQGITLLLIGAGLTLFPVIIPTAKDAVVGTSAKVSKVSGGDMSTLIGGDTGGGK